MICGVQLIEPVQLWLYKSHQLLSMILCQTWSVGENNLEESVICLFALESIIHSQGL